MSVNMTLPTSEQLMKSVEDVDQCRTLVLQALNYGITGNDESSSDERVRDATTVLTDAWEECPGLEDVLVDGLWLCSSPCDSDKSSSVLTEIIKSLVQVPDRSDFWLKLQCNLPPSLLDTSGLVSEQDLLKKLTRHKTQIHYKQQKYNLLQEESEGYSKVLQFLLSGYSQLEDPDQQRRRLRQLIGAFELDPNRVLDLVLDVLEAKLYPSESSFEAKHDSPHFPQAQDPLVGWLLDLIKEFSRDKLPPLIGFKLMGEEEGGVSSLRLLGTIAFLSIKNILDLRTMVKEYLAPIEQSIVDAHRIFWVKEKGRVQALGRVSLSGTTKEDPKQAELAERLEKLTEPINRSPVITLLLILLEWREWDLVENLLSIESWSKLCNILPTKFGVAICDLVQDKVLTWCRSRSRILAVDLAVNSGPRSVAGVESAPGLTIDEAVRAISKPLLCTVQSGCISRRPILFCQLCRLFRSLLDEENCEEPQELSDEAYAFFRSFLVPSLSLYDSNSALSSELWSVLERIPYATRYRLYRDWRGPGLEKSGLGSSLSTMGKPLVNVESEMNAGKAARYALKRLSKDTIRDMSRQLAKVAHSNPLVVFTTILNQIESYDNMIEVMVEAQRFVNELSLDVLGYCILSRLSGMAGGVNRSRLKDDGVNVSQWMQSLESFAGALYKRCPEVELRGMLCYLMRRLRSGNVMELGMLRTILKTAGGYNFEDFSPASSLNMTQLEGRAGSIILKRETMSFGIVEEMNHTASNKIRSVLTSDGFGVSILILIVQARSSIIFEMSKEEPKPVKLIGNLYDSCQVVLSILLEFLTNTLDVSKQADGKPVPQDIVKYAAAMPTLAELHSSYGFDLVSAWALCRPLVRATTMFGVNAQKNGEASCASRNRLELFALNHETREACKRMVPNSTWSVLSPCLFESFFTNTLYDLFCPENVYEAELTRLNKEIERIQQRQKGGAATSLHAGTAPSKKDDEDVARLKSVSASLSADLQRQKDHVAGVHVNFESLKDKYFPSKEVSRQAINVFLSHCVYPRGLQSPDDAMFCARFALLLHRIETPGFSMIVYIDSLVSVVSGALVCITEGEASNLAILLWETWKAVNKWRYDEKTYESEVSGKPGACIDRPASTSDDSREEDRGYHDPVSYKAFATLFNKWQRTLGNALSSCLQSPEYMHTRACLLVLTRIVEVFPTQPKLGNKLLEVLAPLQDESSSRPDIRASANAYAMMLLKARDEGRWIEEDAAVAKARVEKEKAAAEKRKKKAEEQFQEMKRESDKITEAIGPRDGARDRHDRRRMDFDTRAPAHGDAFRSKSSPVSHPNENGGTGRTATDEPNYRAMGARVESGEIASRDRREHHARRGETMARSSPQRDADLGRERERSNGEERSRGRDDSNAGQSGWSGDRQHGPDLRRSSREDSRGLADRWSRGDTQLDGRGTTRGNKRSRPSSPETSNDGGRTDRGTREIDRDGRSSKRPRTGPASGSTEYESRPENRGSSPPRRGSPPRTPPQRSNRRRR